MSDGAANFCPRASIRYDRCGASLLVIVPEIVPSLSMVRSAVDASGPSVCVGKLPFSRGCRLWRILGASLARYLKFVAVDKTNLSSFFLEEVAVGDYDDWRFSRFRWSPGGRHAKDFAGDSVSSRRAASGARARVDRFLRRLQRSFGTVIRRNKRKLGRALSSAAGETARGRELQRSKRRLVP